MRMRVLALALLGVVLSGVPMGVAQERGSWRPASKTAQSITGDITFLGDRMTINFFSLTVAQIRALTPDETSAVFETGGDLSARPNAGGAAASAGHLYRLSIPGDRRFLHKNTLCGTDETQWMATYVVGKELQLAFFSTATPPVFTAEAIGGSTSLCGTFAYVR